MFEVGGKCALITGGAQGLGLQFARRLLQERCKVCITDIDENKGQESKKELQRQFGIKDDGIYFIKFDVTEKGGWNRVWDEAEKVLGGKIEIFGNNAGINPSFGWEKCLDVMSVAATRGVFTAYERMSLKRGGKGGRIINTASIAGLDTSQLSKLESAGYNVSKHGLVALTRFFTCLPSISKNEGIKCYAIAPFLADTNLVRSHIKDALEAGKPLVHNSVEIRTMTDFNKASPMRYLTAEEVGHAFMESLKQDKNGAVYLIMPDMPLIEYPNEIASVMLAVIIVANKIGTKLGVEVFTPMHFYAIVGVLLFMVLFFVHTLIGFIL